MSWVTIIWSMMASACLTLAGMHLLVWCRKRTAWANLLFALTAVGTAGLGFCELWLMRAQTVEDYGMIVRWGHVPFWLLFISLVGLSRLYLRAGRVWLAWTVCGLRTLSLILDFVFTPNLNYRAITLVRHIRFLGESVTVAEGIPNPWMLIGQTSLLLFLVFLVDATFTLWRRGERRSLLMLSIAMVVFISLATAQFVLAFWGISDSPMTPSLFFLGVVAAMAYEMSRDTLRARQLSDDLKKHGEWLDLAADSAGVGMWSWDFKTNLIWVTEGARRLYGFSSDEPVPFKDFLSRVHPEDLDWVVQASKKCLQEGADFRYDYRIVMPDGSIRWMKVLAKTFLTPAGEPERMSGVSIDITQQKRAELELQLQRDELTHLSRVTTLSALSGSLAHELNQPLGIILSNTQAAQELLLQKPPDLKEVSEILSDIVAADRRATEIIQGLRTLLKRGETSMQSLSLNDLLEEVLRLVRTDLIKRGVITVCSLDPDLPPITGERVQLQQLALNLILNAADSMTANITSMRRLYLTTSRHQHSVRVSVRDEGAGLPADIERLFQPFYSTKSDGLGMGLAICRSIIGAHNGRLWADAHPEGGAVFHFELPVANSEDNL